MRRQDLEETTTTGDVLPEDSRFRLRKLHEHMVFLSRLAQPRPHDAEHARGPEIRTAELAACLELLAEQAKRVLDTVSWPAERMPQRSFADASKDFETEPDDASAASAGPGEEPALFPTGTVRFTVTLDQIDALNRLVDALVAQADLVIAAEDSELANGTLAQLGQALWDGAAAVRRIVQQVEDQRLDATAQTRTGVSEERATYGIPITAQALPGLTRRRIPRRVPTARWQESQLLH